MDEFLDKIQREKMRELWDSKDLNFQLEITPDMKEAQEKMALAIQTIILQINKRKDDHYLLTGHKEFSMPIMKEEGDYSSNFTVMCDDCKDLQ